MPRGVTVLALVGVLLSLAFVQAPEMGRQSAADDVPLNPDCPVQNRAFEPGPGDVCFGQTGPNYAVAFYYPHAAARIPRLNGELRAAMTMRASSDDGFRSLVSYARQHPETRLFSQTVYRVDADSPELLALSSDTEEYAGGSHGWSRYDPLLWDRAADRQIQLRDLFSSPRAAFAEIERLFCPVFNEAQRLEFTRGGGSITPRCPSAPYPASLVQGASGRIETIHFEYRELHGYAGGAYTADIPVTQALVNLLHPRFRGAFQVSTAQPRACNSNLPDDLCRPSNGRAGEYRVPLEAASQP